MHVRAWPDADTWRGAQGMTLGGQIQFLAFNVFEGCVGVFWPAMMKVCAHTCLC